MKTACIICAGCGSTFERAPGRGRPRKFCTACVPPVTQGRADSARAWREKTGYNDRHAAERRGSAAARERNRAYYAAHRAAVLERVRRYREQNREIINARARRRYAEGNVRRSG